MKIPTEFKGKVYFLLDAKYGYLTMLQDDTLNAHKDYIYLGCTEEMHIKFDTCGATERAVESLRAQITTERAESQRRIQIMQGRIQELLALESK